MKIYTYYQNIGHSKQDELVELWQTNWSRHGFKAIILNIDDAKKHPYFDEFDFEMRRFFLEIVGSEIGDYGMSCWHRWLAYATQPHEKFYVSDYDAININFPKHEPGDLLTLYDNACPFFASGTPMQFDHLCRAFVDISSSRFEILKDQANWYHDQNFFIHNFTKRCNAYTDELCDKYGILMTRDRDKIGGAYDPIKGKILAGPHRGFVDLSDYGVVHVSHESIAQLQDRYIEYENHDLTDLRIEVMSEIA